MTYKKAPTTYKRARRAGWQDVSIKRLCGTRPWWVEGTHPATGERHKWQAEGDMRAPGAA